jgi:hypothetical protein
MFLSGSHSSTQPDFVLAGEEDMKTLMMTVSDELYERLRYYTERRNAHSQGTFTSEQNAAMLLERALDHWQDEEMRQEIVATLPAEVQGNADEATFNRLMDELAGKDSTEIDRLLAELDVQGDIDVDRFLREIERHQQQIRQVGEDSSD